MEEELKEMLSKRPDELEGETLKLFKAIMKIADERDELKEIEESHRKENGELREKVKELEEDNYAYHQLMRMQNEREYRSKFLKDFEKEYGENVMPDYDEIYKRYDKQKKQLANSIPISLVKETIEKLKENGYWNYLEKRDLETTIDILQELLERRK